MKTLKDRLYSRITISDSGCWEWTGPTDRGYGKIRASGTPLGRNTRTHRASWFLSFGEIPAGLDVCHTCITGNVCNIVRLCLGVSRGLVWVNHKTRYREKTAIHPARFLDFPIYSEVIWDRGGSLTLNARKFAPSHEYFFGFGQPHYWDDNFNTEMSVWRVSKQGNAGHVCAYPESLISPIVAASCPPEGIVLDPFSGSGTTVRVAKDLGRKAIGIEIEEKYCEIAARRLSQEVLAL